MVIRIRSWHLLLLSFICSIALAAPVTLNWTAPTQNTDGSALTDLAGFKIYYGTDATNLAQTLAVNNATATSVATADLSPATWYFAITALSTSGGESAPSNIATKVVVAPSTVPVSPTIAPQTAYYIVQQPHTPIMIAVGNVPAGVVCDATTSLLVGGTTYFVVPEAALVPYGNTKPKLIWARCG